MPQNAQQPSFAECIRDTRHSAVHLEMRDDYGDNDRFAAWRRGDRIDWDDRSSWWRGFHDQIAEAVARGVSIRRVRVVSEPVAEYIRWEHYMTRANLAAGEQVRWVPRRLASDLVLPCNDYWLFDEGLARVHHFAGNGSLVADEFTSESDLLKLFAASFETAWERGIPHEEYQA
ncbi:hypothetical protein OHS33_14290 [Streptomyces sp. NBC_00536]|uniref:DUF6879 family protein n=1 Tax=Streptomyces sp. NBC_00536 TaxID=2975769 RepID=UPI002E80797D|nr:DUF6879 family protein [Streptomyces sp. NBC_00536]WUC79399.1 hypothetical protein OHS33_14290 [Streptomyces sp. NBC_00536]